MIVSHCNWTPNRNRLNGATDIVVTTPQAMTATEVFVVPPEATMPVTFTVDLAEGEITDKFFAFKNKKP